MWSQSSSYLEPRWQERCAAFVFSLHSCFSMLALFLFFCFPANNLPFFLFPLLSQFDRCLDVPMWGLKAGLQGLLAMGAFYCQRAGWSQWRPLGIPGTHLPLNLKQLLIFCFQFLSSIIGEKCFWLVYSNNDQFSQLHKNLGISFHKDMSLLC